MQLTTYQEYLETKTKYMYICTTVYFFGNPVVFIQKLTQPNHGLASFTYFCPYVFWFFFYSFQFNKRKHLFKYIQYI